LKLCFWRFRRMKLSILLLGLVLTLLPSFFCSRGLWEI
jgi:hypothetical protein